MYFIIEEEEEQIIQQSNLWQTQTIYQIKSVGDKHRHNSVIAIQWVFVFLNAAAKPQHLEKGKNDRKHNMLHFIRIL